MSSRLPNVFKWYRKWLFIDIIWILFFEHAGVHDDIKVNVWPDSLHVLLSSKFWPVWWASVHFFWTYNVQRWNTKWNVRSRKTTLNPFGLPSWPLVWPVVKWPSSFTFVLTQSNGQQLGKLCFTQLTIVKVNEEEPKLFWFVMFLLWFCLLSFIFCKLHFYFRITVDEPVWLYSILGGAFFEIVKSLKEGDACNRDDQKWYPYPNKDTAFLFCHRKHG